MNIWKKKSGGNGNGETSALATAGSNHAAAVAGHRAGVLVGRTGRCRHCFARGGVRRGGIP